MRASQIEKRTPSWFLRSKQQVRAFSAHSLSRQLSGTFGCDGFPRLASSLFSDHAGGF